MSEFFLIFTSCNILHNSLSLGESAPTRKVGLYCTCRLTLIMHRKGQHRDDFINILLNKLQECLEDNRSSCTTQMCSSDCYQSNTGSSCWSIQIATILGQCLNTFIFPVCHDVTFYFVTFFLHIFTSIMTKLIFPRFLLSLWRVANRRSAQCCRPFKEIYKLKYMVGILTSAYLSTSSEQTSASPKRHSEHFPLLALIQPFPTLLLCHAMPYRLLWGTFSVGYHSWCREVPLNAIFKRAESILIFLVGHLNSKKR